MKDLNPYVEARREWNDRYLDLVRARRWWQVAAVSELALVATLGAVLIGALLAHLDFLEEQIDRLSEAITALLPKSR